MFDHLLHFPSHFLIDSVDPLDVLVFLKEHIEKNIELLSDLWNMEMEGNASDLSLYSQMVILHIK